MSVWPCALALFGVVLDTAKPPESVHAPLPESNVGIVASVPAEILLGGGILLQARVNGSGPHTFALDSAGGSGFIVDARLAKTLGLALQGEALSSGAGGNRIPVSFAKNVVLDLSGVLVRPRTIAVRVPRSTRSGNTASPDPVETPGLAGAVPLAQEFLWRRSRKARHAATLAALAVLGVFPAAARDAGEPNAGAIKAAVRSYRAAHEIAILRELAQLLAIPNLASDSENIRRNAAAIVSALEKRGVRASLLDGEGGPPAVFGELSSPDARRTVVFYAHYDGQPVDPARWTGKPWEPVLRDGPLESGGKEVAWSSLTAPVDPRFRLYARSASDDKAPIVGLLTALDALRDARISRSVNLKFFFEGEEEAGSPHLAAILSRNRERLAADLWLFCDGPVHQSGRKLVFFGTRGVTDVEITAYGALRRLHSGHYGNWSPNPAVELARLVASMRDMEGRIAIPGFSDDVRPATDEERRAIGEAPDVDRALKQELGLARTEGEGERIESRILLPALNIRGLAAGDVGERATNSIPTEATASIDFRLVPDQTPEKVQAKVEDFLRAHGFFLVRSTPDTATRLAHSKVLRVEWGTGYPPSRTPMDLPVSREVVKILSDVSGAPVVRLPTLGGSGPNYLFERILKVPVIGVPIVNHDNNQHASNENLRIGNLWDGIEIYAALMAELGPALSSRGP